MKNNTRTQFHRIISLLLMLVLVFNLFAAVAPSTVSAAVEEQVEDSKAFTLEDLLAGAATVEDLYGVLDRSTVPDIIGYEEAQRMTHVKRLYEDEGESLNTVIFLNADGSKTMYVFDYPVKYVDKGGNVKDITLEIADSKTSSSKYQSADNPALTTFSAQFTDGIALSGNGVEIRLIPVLSSANTGNAVKALSASSMVSPEAQRIDEKTVSYRYNEVTTVEYSLTYAGFKEDIVVSEYTGQTEYPFRLYTNGLKLEEIGGSYFLVDDKCDIQATIGDIIIFTADERNNAFGEIVPTTVVENEEYLLNIVVDAEYLADPQTAYPIRIDPTIEIDYNDGTGAIEDITITTNTNYTGSHTSLYVGRRSTEGIARALIRFPGLELDGISGAAITSATLRVRDLMCEAETMNISCHVFTGNVWNANSATWGNVNPNNYEPDSLDTVTMSWSIGDAADPIHWYSFDVKDAVVGWANGTYNKNKGLILKMAQAVENGSTIKNRTFGSFNRASNKPSLTVSYTDGTGGGDDFATASTITLGSSKTITTTLRNEQRYFKFVPTQTLEYVIMSGNYSGDPKVWIYDDAYTNIKTQDDVSYPNNKNFWVKYELEAGKTYYIGVGHAGSYVGTYKFIIVKPATITNGFYHIRNHYSSKLLDICGPGEQEFVHQWTAHTGEQEKWLVQGYVENGEISYYTIRSQFGDNKYIGISSTQTGENNIKLFEDISDETKWNIYQTISSSYILEPITANGLGIYAADTGTGTKMQLSWTASGNIDTKFYLDSYSYEGRTFAAFDLGNSSTNEVSLVVTRLEDLDYFNVGSFDNVDEPIAGLDVIDYARGADIIYINGHGGRGPHLHVQTHDSATGEPFEYIGADSSLIPSDGLPVFGVGAQWKDESTTKTTSSWNLRTKWAILAQCFQLSYGQENNDGIMTEGLYNAEWWARVMLGDGSRMHGIVGYCNRAPKGEEHIKKLNAFFDEAQDTTIVNAWKAAHPSGLLVADTNWGVMYHTANAADTLETFTSATSSSSSYSIKLERYNQSAITLTDLSTHRATITLSDAYPVFEDLSIEEINSLYSLVQDKLSKNKNTFLQLTDDNLIVYKNYNFRTGEVDLGYEISDEEAVAIAKSKLHELGLPIDGDYRTTVSYVKRYNIDPTGVDRSLPETIEYTVHFYRTYKGVDLVSDEEDGIVISFNKYELTNLQYKWRNIKFKTIAQTNYSNICSASQAQACYLAKRDDNSLVNDRNEKTADPVVRAAYLYINNEMIPVWACSDSGIYGHHIFISMLTGKIVNIK